MLVVEQVFLTFETLLLNLAQARVNLQFVFDKLRLFRYQENIINSSALPLTSRQRLLLDDEVLDAIEKAILDPRISPLSATDEELATLPRTHILASEYDPLRDEAVTRISLGFFFILFLCLLQCMATLIEKEEIADL